MARRLAEGDMEADDVRSFQELVERRDEAWEAGVVASGVNDLHVEAACPLRDGPSNAPEADEAQSRSGVFGRSRIVDTPFDKL